MLRARRTFCRRLGMALAGRQLPHHYVRLSAGVKADLRMWGMFLERFNGIPLQSWQVVDWEVQIFSGAAGGSGLGVYWDGKYCAESWPAAWTRGGGILRFWDCSPSSSRVASGDIFWSTCGSFSTATI
ncbi:hypothetical protein NDU88_001817 [Pleurodeles waltl]|uniref:Uncharacterized protein n=1 Tax=Pleurodeles waltl TaxID=8319 RepID=A0AAV7M0L9_PLEWA|nr:hypothetical protein NDU88_001817 [Pleurodeles waltl]